MGESPCDSLSKTQNGVNVEQSLARSRAVVDLDFIPVTTRCT